MSESKFETVSSFIDNYQLNDQALSDIVKDEQMSGSWNRYHLIGDAIRDELLEQSTYADLSVNIASAIAAEPTVLAPQRKTFIEHSKATIVKLAKPFGQVAIAASAATLMIMGVQHNVADNEELLPLEQVVQTIPFGGVTDTVSYDVTKSAQANELNQQTYIEQQRHFQSLFADHQQQLKYKKLIAAKKQENTTSEISEEKVEAETSAQ